MTGVWPIELRADDRHAILAIRGNGDQMQRLIPPCRHIHTEPRRIETIRGYPSSPEATKIGGDVARQRAKTHPACAHVHMIVPVGRRFAELEWNAVHG